MEEKFYIVWYESLETECVSKYSALTNSAVGIYTDKSKAIERAVDIADHFEGMINLGRGTMCGGKYTEATVYCYEAKRDEESGQLIQTDVIYKKEL